MTLYWSSMTVEKSVLRLESVVFVHSSGVKGVVDLAGMRAGDNLSLDNRNPKERLRRGAAQGGEEAEGEERSISFQTFSPGRRDEEVFSSVAQIDKGC